MAQRRGPKYEPVYADAENVEIYEVFAKLGCGGYSTVWLCFDTQNQKWRAVKVMAAVVSTEDCADLKIMEALKGLNLEGTHIMLPMGYFWIDGLNGRHLCLVLPVLGPSVREVLQESLTVRKDIMWQVAQGLQFLHDHNICHGDLRTDNIMLRMPCLDHITKDEMETLLEEPEKDDVHTLDERGEDPVAPKYLVSAQRIKMKPELNAAIIDFGV
ncbi:Uu.00g120730.m01.CDS01 [Anthostomella pinea]|uniref:EKC/KEOPS complex subunit BUD32 n=1 Tax=Anthostomella pinea TaxID=933095 RepID=A0AAI8YH84_9PEZI|nr:Uu.00g120730.m01.CDS01 [Anthostomella pinea]